MARRTGATMRWLVAPFPLPETSEWAEENRGAASRPTNTIPGCGSSSSQAGIGDRRRRCLCRRLLVPLPDRVRRCGRDVELGAMRHPDGKPCLFGRGGVGSRQPIRHRHASGCWSSCRCRNIAASEIQGASCLKVSNQSLANRQRLGYSRVS